MHRRHFLRATAGATAYASLAGCRSTTPEPRWTRAAYRKPPSSRVAILKADAYDGRLVEVVRRGVELFRLDVRGRRVLLKPNLVELDRGGVVNTNPALVLAAVEAFRSLGAREVIVGEGPGHRRDNQYILGASGMLDVLRESRTPYVDLNTASTRAVRLPSRFTALGVLHLPTAVLDADLLVSMPKLKTHHWAGVTLSLKNMFGIVPSMHYGWPKNVLHHHGIAESILDINTALHVPRFNIVDGVIGMEGNGPIQGTARHSGVVVFGADPVAVDATCARLMSIHPERVGYLREANAFLGNLEEERIVQAGEDPVPLRQEYQLLERFRELAGSSAARRG